MDRWKAEMGRIREEKRRRRSKRESLRRKKIQARKKVGKSRRGPSLLIPSPISHHSALHVLIGVHVLFFPHLPGDFIRAVILLLLQFLLGPRPCLHQLPPPLPPCQLFAKLFANFRAQCALLDLNLGPSQLSAHSTWDLPSSVRAAGPQPGTFPAQCAPLDLNLGPSELSAHRWTSTWDLPEDMPDKV